MLKKIIHSIGRLLDRAPVLLYLAVGLLAAALFIWVQSSGNIPDPDSSYHARMAALIAERGPIHDFPWLTKTIFADYYVDHHFLYHVLLIPFVIVFGLAEGITVSAIFFGVAAVLGAAFLLRRLGVGKAAFLAPVLLLLSNPMVFRLNLAKTPAVSLLTLFLGWYAAARNRPVLLGFVAFAYVWLYDGWILLPVAVATVLLAYALVPDETGTPTEERGWHWRDRLFGQRVRRLAGATLAGIVLGHVVNPYVPENLAFEWLHIVRIGLLGLDQGIGVGAEWLPYSPGNLFAGTATTFLALILGIVSFFIAFMTSRDRGERLPQERVRDTVGFFLFALLALAFTLRSMRNVEYFVPFAVFFSVSAIDLFIGARGLRNLLPSGRSLFGRRAVGLIVLVAYLVLFFSLIAYRDLTGVKKDFDRGRSPDKYAGLAGWLEGNTPPGSTVFHNDWDDFPHFFLHNTHNRWIVALDTRFMHVRDPGLYQEWVDITRGNTADRLAERIKDDFGAEYVFIDTDHEVLKKNIEADGRFRLVYSDAEGYIYEIIPGR